VLVVQVSHPLSQFPEAAYPAEGTALLAEVKTFLLAEKLIDRDFTLDSWRANDA
jgi:sulfonate transport system substrate-binding protein